jgi:hypothetical protein
MRIHKKTLYGTSTFFIVVILLITLFPLSSHMNMNEMRNEFISMKEEIHHDMLMDGKYACCLEKPCIYCIEKSPGHGEGAECNCLGDVMNGVHPCGECIGEILEGHGNRFLAPYFATAIAEKTGELEAIQLIVEDKYDIPVADQI